MPRKTSCKSPLDALETCESPAKDMPVAATSESKLRKSGVLKYELLLLISVDHLGLGFCRPADWHAEGAWAHDL